MPRRKGNGIPPTKRTKCVEESSKEENIKRNGNIQENAEKIQKKDDKNDVAKVPQQVVNATTYLHKKFKKMATASSDDDTEIARVPDIPKTMAAVSSAPVACATSVNSDTLDVHVVVPSSPKVVSSGSPSSATTDDDISPLPPSINGRYICPYCKLICNKPSVLQKHIRAHTNERPFPCLPCGFAFKTRSNLFKHCRSRSHTLKIGENGIDSTGGNKTASEEEQQVLLPSEDDEDGSDSQNTPPATQPQSPNIRNEETVTKTIYKPKFHKAVSYLQNFVSPAQTSVTITSVVGSPERYYENTVMEVNNLVQKSRMVAESQEKVPTDVNSNNHITGIYAGKSVTEVSRTNKLGLQLKIPPSQQIAANSTPSNVSPFNSGSSPSPEFLQRHISKLISENQAIVETTDPLWTRKYQTKLANALLQPGKSAKMMEKLCPEEIDLSQPLNLSKPKEFPQTEMSRKRSYADAIYDYQEPSSERKYGNFSECNGLVSFSDIMKKMKPKDVRERLSNIEHVCSLCDESFENYEKLKNHILYQCKGKNKQLASSYRQPPSAQKSVLVDGKVMGYVSPPQPSPGPLLGSTPLVGNYQRVMNSSVIAYAEKNKNPSKYSSVIIDNGKSATSLKSLEDLSRTPVKDTQVDYIGSVRISESQTEFSQKLSYPVESTADIPRVMPGIKPVGGILVHVPVTVVESAKPKLASCEGVVSYVTPAENQVILSSTEKPYTIGGGITTIVHGGRAIPYVPGMPGPQSMEQPPQNAEEVRHSVIAVVPAAVTMQTEEPKFVLGKNGVVQRENVIVVPVNRQKSDQKVDLEISEAVGNNAPKYDSVPVKKSDLSDVPSTNCGTEDAECSGNKFVRPTFLPLKPGTYVPKRYRLGTTPVLPLVSPETPRPKKSYGQLYLGGNAYTYLGMKCSTRMTFCTVNKSQPTYVPLGPEHSKLSMYSNWKVCSEDDACIPGIKLTKALSCYDSRQRQSMYTVAYVKMKDVMTHSSCWFNKLDSTQKDSKSESETNVENQLESDMANNNNEQIEPESQVIKIPKSYDDSECQDGYMYIRGRGRGRYVCTECGLRCKKPSVLRKHSRTHTDIRPYTCKHCVFSFKTKGNLTKHMKSKTHYKRCMQLGISPVPTVADDSYIDLEKLAQQAQLPEWNENAEAEEEDEDDEDDEEDEDEDDDEDGDDGDNEENESRTYDENILADDGKRQLEREAVKSLLSLSEMTHQSVSEQYANAGLVSLTVRPRTYPYVLCPLKRHSNDATTPTLSSVSEQKEREQVSNNTGLAREFQPVSDINQNSCESSGRYYFGTASAVVNEPATGTEQEIEADNQVRASVPIDLSNKEKKTATKFSDFLIPQPTTPVSEILTPVSEPLLLATICSTTEKLQVSPSLGTNNVEQDTMLHTYLKERAVQDVRMKQQQQYKFLRSNDMDATDFSAKYSIYNEVFQSSMESPRRIDVEEPRQVLEVTSLDTEAIVHLERKASFSYNNENYKEYPQYNEKTAMYEASTTVYGNEEPRFNEQMMSNQVVPDMNRADTEISVIQSPKKLKAEFMPPTSAPLPKYARGLEDGRKCAACNKVFNKPSQLRLHMNIHYFEQPFRCEFCAVSFRTRGHLHKHLGSDTHLKKVSMNSTSGVTFTNNPRPFKCDDCGTGFRIHGHLAKHLRSKMHIMKLECLGKLPFGTYAEMERCGVNMNDIDTTDCENSLESLQRIAKGVVGTGTDLADDIAPMEIDPATSY